MSTLGDIRGTLEGALHFGPNTMKESIKRLLATIPRDGEIVTVEELAWAMHAELCGWKFHTTTCLDHWRERAAVVLAQAREGPD